MNFKNKIKSTLLNIIKYFNNKKIPDTITIFSNDCWGGECYKFLDRKYAYPFVGTYLMAPCYLKFLQNPKHYLNQELIFFEISKYDEVEKARSDFRYRFPVGILDDIEVQFMHYENEEEAKFKWYKRIERINWSAIYIKYDISKDLAKLEDIEIIDTLQFQHKIVIGKDFTKSYSSNYLKINSWELNGAKMFEKSLKKFDIYTFVLGNGIKMTLRSKCISFLLD